jgi:hypothetical protein
MSKFARPIVLAVAMAALAGGAMTTAQDKKAATPQDKKKDDKKEVKGKVEYYEGNDGWRIRVKNADGKTFLMSNKGVATKEDVLKELEDAKAILANIKPTEGESTKKDKGKDKDK